MRERYAISREGVVEKGDSETGADWGLMGRGKLFTPAVQWYMIAASRIVSGGDGRTWLKSR
jgi:hypothetical protein